eukprot:CAMPEP_0118933324 /NCGR_PEP_ID=MMETSP1169-20130426/11925_1 /TAXON_ID=36882 /ORGANISM="Pyramimonas obovata, Strain CCMP722" /LENGTH=672 /DNA_ID=CAMNT_0006876073 /DNA_START=223 /DNA_END=2237 /DNA_ORIENTATION=+
MKEEDGKKPPRIGSLDDLSAQFERSLSNAKKSFETGLADLDRKLQNQQLAPPLKDVSRMLRQRAGQVSRGQASGASDMVSFRKNWGLTTRPTSTGENFTEKNTGKFVPWQQWNEIESSLRKRGEASLRGFSQALGLDEQQASGPHFSSIVKALTASNGLATRKAPSMDGFQNHFPVQDDSKQVSTTQRSLDVKGTRSFLRKSRSEPDLGAIQEPASSEVLTQEAESKRVVRKPRGSQKSAAKASSTNSFPDDDSLAKAGSGSSMASSNSGFMFDWESGPLAGSIRHVKTALGKNWETEKDRQRRYSDGAKELPPKGFRLSASDRDLAAGRSSQDVTSSSDRTSGEFWQELQKNVKENGAPTAIMLGLVKTMQHQFPGGWQELSAKLDEVQKSTLKNMGILQDDEQDGDTLEVRDTGKPKEGPLQAVARRIRSGRKPAEVFQSIREKGRSFAIVTTASLPWMTGTSVNPLLRAAYLSQEDSRKVTLVVPFLPHVDQKNLHPGGQVFDTPEEQEVFIRSWVANRVGFTPGPNFNIKFYPGRYSKRFGCVFSVGDITSYIPSSDADVAVLEEPEHLNWFHHGPRWTDKFKHVVGIVHTNYLEYAKREENGDKKEIFMRTLNQVVCRFHCNKVVKLSGAVQDMPRSETMFVHGVSPQFLRIGDKKAADEATTVVGA